MIKLTLLIVFVVSVHAYCITQTIQPFDTCIEIADRCNTTIALIEEVNPDLCTYPRVGRELCCNHGELPRECDASTVCPLNACCNSKGRCGFGDEYCGAGCQRDCTPKHYPIKKRHDQLSIGYFHANSHQRPCINSSILEISQLYTHVNYAFGYMDDDFDIAIHNDLLSTMDLFALSSTKYKKILSVADVYDNNGMSMFSNMVTYNKSRFIDAVKQVIVARNLDGVDLYWPHVGALERGGRLSDGIEYLKLVADLRVALTWSVTISVAAPASYTYLRRFNIREMSASVSHINYMTYDMHGTQCEYCHTDTPKLRSHFDVRDIRLALSMMATADVPAYKLALGVSTHARTFELADPGCTGSSCNFGMDTPSWGECTAMDGVLGRAEVQELKSIQDQWIDRQSNSIVTKYDDTYIAYMPSREDSLRMISYAKLAGLGGSVIWTIDLDNQYYPTRDPLCALDKLSNIVDADYLPASCRMYGYAAVLYNRNKKHYDDLMKVAYDSSYDKAYDHFVEKITDEYNNNTRHDVQPVINNVMKDYGMQLYNYNDIPGIGKLLYDCNTTDLPRNANLTLDDVGLQQLYNGLAAYGNISPGMVDMTHVTMRCDKYNITYTADRYPVLKNKFTPPTLRTLARSYLGAYEALERLIHEFGPYALEWSDVVDAYSIPVSAIRFTIEPLKEFYTAIETYLEQHKLNEAYERRRKEMEEKAKNALVAFILGIVSVVAGIASLGATGIISAALLSISAGTNIAAMIISPPETPFEAIMTIVGVGMDASVLFAVTKGFSISNKLRVLGQMGRAGRTGKIITLAPELSRDVNKVQGLIRGVCKVV